MNPTRAIDDKLWKDAVKALQTAVQRDPKLVLPRANLGLAYIVHPDGKPHTAEALDHFRKAADFGTAGLNRLNYSAFCVNFGVAELAAGLHESAAFKFSAARKNIEGIKGLSVADELSLALLYNEALVGAASPEKEIRTKAVKSLETFLTRASPDSMWWALAFERYESLARQLDVESLPRADLAKRAGKQRMRVVTSVEVAPGKLISLSEETVGVLKVLGRERMVGVPLFEHAKIKRYSEVSPGVDLLGDKDRVLAIFLTSDQAPPVEVQGEGTGAKKKELRVGMLVRDLEAAVAGQPAEQCYIDNATIEYVYLPYLGLGYRVTGDRVTELVLAQVPRK